MSAGGHFMRSRFGLGAGLLWVTAAALAAGTHAGVAYWAIQQTDVLPAEAAAPAAIMIELAAAPMAPEATEDEIAPDLYDAPEISAAPPETLAEPLRPEMAQMPALPTTAAPPPPDAPPAVAAPATDALPTIDMPPAPPSEVAVAEAQPETRPVARPENLTRVTPPEPPRTAERQPDRQQPPPPATPSQAASQARVQTATPAPVAAATQTSRGREGSISPARWQSKLMAHLERHKRYPASARQRRHEGVVLVRFTIDTGGHLQTVQLARSSGHTELDEAVLALVRRASPVPAPPPDAPRDITAPVRFQIR